MHFICLERFSDLWKEIPVFDLNFSQQITSFSLIITWQNYQTPCFASPPFMYFQLGAVSSYPQDCNSFARVHRLNQHMEICSSTKQQPGAVESCSSQQMCCQHTRKGYAQITSEVTLSFGFRAFYFTFSNEVGAAREASLCLVNKRRTFRAVSNAGLTNTRCCWSTNAPHIFSSSPSFSTWKNISVPLGHESVAQL